MRQEERVGDAVRNMKTSAERIRKRMHRAGVHRTEAKPAVETAERQRGAGLKILAIANCTFQIGNIFIPVS